MRYLRKFNENNQYLEELDIVDKKMDELVGIGDYTLSIINDRVYINFNNPSSADETSEVGEEVIGHLDFEGFSGWYVVIHLIKWFG